MPVVSKNLCSYLVRYHLVRYGGIERARHSEEEVLLSSREKLLVMIVDEGQPSQELGYRRILKSRNQERKGKSVGTFMGSSINFGATKDSELNE